MSLKQADSPLASSRIKAGAGSPRGLWCGADSTAPYYLAKTIEPRLAIGKAYFDESAFLNDLRKSYNYPLFLIDKTTPLFLIDKALLSPMCSVYPPLPGISLTSPLWCGIPIFPNSRQVARVPYSYMSPNRLPWLSDSWGFCSLSPTCRECGVTYPLWVGLPSFFGVLTRNRGFPSFRGLACT